MNSNLEYENVVKIEELFNNVVEAMKERVQLSLDFW